MSDVPKSHPYIARIIIDPADLGRLKRWTEDDPALNFIGVDTSEPDQWPVEIGCASQRVRDAVEDRWG